MGLHWDLPENHPRNPVSRHKERQSETHWRQGSNPQPHGQYTKKAGRFEKTSKRTGPCAKSSATTTASGPYGRSKEQARRNLTGGAGGFPPRQPQRPKRKNWGRPGLRRLHPVLSAACWGHGAPPALRFTRQVPRLALRPRTRASPEIGSPFCSSSVVPFTSNSSTLLTVHSLPPSLGISKTFDKIAMSNSRPPLIPERSGKMPAWPRNPADSEPSGVRQNRI